MRWVVVGLVLALGGCAAQSSISSAFWYDGTRRIAPEGGKVFVCHGFGCNYKTPVEFGRRDVAQIRRFFAGTGSAAAERKAIQRYIAWAERRVAPAAGSADDVAGLDLGNARVRGQMDCIDEATNTTSYLLVAQDLKVLRFHTVESPVARGYFLDGRYPHATAVIKESDSGATFAVDSWPLKNGVQPLVMPLSEWFAQSPTLPS